MRVSRSWRARLRTLMLEAMAALADAKIRPPTEAAEVVETHSAVILAYGADVLKMKKPVFLQFLDFRTAAARARACDREVELNRRLSPDVYLDSVTITGHGGDAYDHGVLMRRMPRDR